MKPTNPVERPRLFRGYPDKYKFIAFIQGLLDRDIVQLTEEYERLFSRIERHEGTVTAVKKAKSYYDVALRYAAGLKFDPIPYCKSDRDGFPKVLRPFRKLLDGPLDSKRAALTVLQLYKLVDCQADYSLTSITGPYLGNEEPSWLSAFDEVLEELFPIELQDERRGQLMSGIHLSGKNGPNGPALRTAPIDREAIRGTSIEESVVKLVNLTQNLYLEELLDESQEEPFEEVVHPRRTLEHSRLRIKYEPGAKSRIFAIVDYFTQSALLPIHKYLMSWLKTQKTDGTSNHSNAANTVRRWTDGRYGKNLWSFDLTTATDRYPRFLEKRVIAQIFGQEIADSWEDVISNRDFLAPNGARIRFETGQPLGALSSWAAFAVTHHVHIRTAALLNGTRAVYRIIGDDITIAKDPLVALTYIDMMSDLAVPFSGAKSILPHQMKESSVAELAKRVFRDGDEITPVPPDAILEGLETPMGYRNLIETCINRGYARAGQIYPVQSSIPSQGWMSTLTFPIRNRLPQIHEVKVVIPFWENRDESPPGGINPGWFSWSDFSEQDLDSLLYEVIRKEVSVSRVRAELLRNRLYTYSLIGPDEPPKGGDWQPEPWELHMFMLPRIMDYMTQRLEDILLEIQTAPPGGDVFEYLGGLHSFLEPDRTFFGRDYDDEKVKTKVFFSRTIAIISKILAHRDPIDAMIKYLTYESEEPS